MSNDELREVLEIVSPAVIALEIGRKDDLTYDTCTTSEQAVHDAIAAAPTAKIVLSIGGYDDDLRELWQIPEVVDFAVLFVAMAGSGLARRLAPESRAWILQCCLAWKDRAGSSSGATR